MKIGYFSPFNPEKSGISDFSEELVMSLKEYMDITIFTNCRPTNKEIIKQFACHTVRGLNEEIIKQQDLLIYHIGNHYDYHNDIIEAFLKYGGILEIHDLALHNFIAQKYFVNKRFEEYIDILRYCHGDRGVEAAKGIIEGRIRAPWETHALEFMANKQFVDKAQAVIVHSDFAKQMIRGINSEVPIINIPLHCTNIQEEYLTYKKQCKSEFCISEGTLVMGAFGFATSAKRICQTLEALALFKENVNQEFYYYIVGEVQDQEIVKTIKQLNLQDNVKITGFTTIEQFEKYMGACDFCFNLRYPTQGESSASLHRMLGLGKPVIVSDVGTFSEYPEKIVLKVRHDSNEIADILKCIKILTSSEKKLNDRSKYAIKYAKKHCDLNKNANRYAKFFKEILKGTYQDNFIDIMVDRLIEIGVTNEGYIKRISRCIELEDGNKVT